MLAPLHQELKIQQKTVTHRPTDKLQDCLLAIMQGAEAVSQVNSRLKSDPALWLAFGRPGCADQSSIQQTLSACDAANVAQMQTALRLIFQAHSRASRHNYEQSPLILDIDITGYRVVGIYEEHSKVTLRAASLVRPGGNSTGSVPLSMMKSFTNKSALVILVRRG